MSKVKLELVGDNVSDWLSLYLEEERIVGNRQPGEMKTIKTWTVDADELLQRVRQIIEQSKENKYKEAIKKLSECLESLVKTQDGSCEGCVALKEIVAEAKEALNNAKEITNG